MKMESSFDKPVLSEAEGLRMNGKMGCKTLPFILSLSKDEGRPGVLFDE